MFKTYDFSIQIIYTIQKCQICSFSLCGAGGICHLSDGSCWTTQEPNLMASEKVQAETINIGTILSSALSVNITATTRCETDRARRPAEFAPVQGRCATCAQLCDNSPALLPKLGWVIFPAPRACANQFSGMFLPCHMRYSGNIHWITNIPRSRKILLFAKNKIDHQNLNCIGLHANKREIESLILFLK